VRSESWRLSELAAELGLVLRRRQSDGRLPSASAAVFRDGEVVWAEALGLADVEAGTEATPDTQYRIGSITKTFTAAAVLQLRDAGRLDLDDRLGEHLDDIPHPAPTLRRLMSHLSGLQREVPGEIWESLQVPDREGFLASLADAEQILRPGTHWHYSNLGFALLGEVVERVAGQPYRTYVEERLLEPLGLRRTSFDGRPPTARGYLVDAWSDAARLEPDVDLSGTAASGQLWSTTGDLARWAAFLSEGREGVLAADSVAEMRAVQGMMDVERWTVGWGLGLELVRRGDKVWAGHGGAMPGQVAGVVFRPQESIGAAVLANSGAFPGPEGLALELAEKALDLVPAEPERWRPAAAPAPEVAALLGSWWSEGYEHVFRWHEGRLVADLLVAPEYRRRSVFAPEGADRWRVAEGRERGELLRVVRDESGAPVKLYWATYPFTRTPQTFGS
jgi:CubicO group peptidase (beta-lactamase class C family)